MFPRSGTNRLNRGWSRLHRALSASEVSWCVNGGAGMPVRLRWQRVLNTQRSPALHARPAPDWPGLSMSVVPRGCPTLLGIARVPSHRMCEPDSSASAFNLVRRLRHHFVLDAPRMEPAPRARSGLMAVSVFCCVFVLDAPRVEPAPRARSGPVFAVGVFFTCTRASSTRIR